MSKSFDLTEETLGYNTAENPTNTDHRFLVAGSKNVLIGQQKTVSSRNGNSRLGVANEAIAPVRNALTWNTSTGTELMIRGYDDEIEVYADTIDGIEIETWTRIFNGISTTAIPRFVPIYDDDEGIDLLNFVVGDDKQYVWNGAVATIASTTTTTITKNGTSTWAQNRFYAAGNKVVNINGTEYTYTGGETTTTLTGVTPDPTGEAANSVALQKVVTNDNTPADGRNNHYISQFQNHVLVGSDEDDLVYVSNNDNHISYTQSSPRIPGEGALLTLDEPTKGFGVLSNNLIIFAGKHSVYTASFFEILIGATLTETLKVKKYQTGELQGAQSPETTVAIGDSILYLSHEPAVRELVSLEQIAGGNDPKTLSNPIKPDMDAEDWTNACAVWFKNAYYLSAPVNGRVYILEFKEDADGKLRRYWQPPQTMSIRPFSPYNAILYGHSGAVPETFRLFDPANFSDVNSADEKIAIACIAKFAYRNYGKRAVLKNFDEYFVEGEISPATNLLTTIYYNFGGATQIIEKAISGDDNDITEETIENATLAQQSLGVQPLGGAITAPANTRKFRAIIEIAKEDFFEIQATFETDDVDKFYSIISHGSNAQLSSRQPNLNKI